MSERLGEKRSARRRVARSARVATTGFFFVDHARARARASPSRTQRYCTRPDAMRTRTTSEDGGAGGEEEDEEEEGRGGGGAGDGGAASAAPMITVQTRYA